MDAVLRSAEANDARDIVRVLRTSRLAFLPYAPSAHSEAQDLERARKVLIPSRGVTLALVDGMVVGVLAVAERDGCGWIDQLYLQPGYCGQGIGTHLLNVALDSLPRPIRLCTFQQNDRARQFYEQFGFRPIGFSDGNSNEERCPDVLYELGGEFTVSRA